MLEANCNGVVGSSLGHSLVFAQGASTGQDWDGRAAKVRLVVGDCDGPGILAGLDMQLQRSPMKLAPSRLPGKGRRGKGSRTADRGDRSDRGEGAPQGSESIEGGTARGSRRREQAGYRSRSVDVGVLSVCPAVTGGLGWLLDIIIQCVTVK
ncbi:hypothetical protein H102_06861 [Trichophyton rubrum CBS 100081]|nr:hypothetical protein H102_06861 [Trichophyton rubrum CBS 100081]